MEIKDSDLKLLSYLVNHNRESITQIAKAIKLTREQVDYKLDKYRKEGLIRKFFPVINYQKLGYNSMTIFFIKFQKPSAIKEFSKRLKDNKNTISYGHAFGKYEFYINAIFKNEIEISKYISEILTKQNHVSDYLLIQPFLVDMYSFKFFNSHKKFEVIEQGSKEIKLDEKEKELLRCLNKDSRMRIIDIADKLKISSELVLHKLKKLKKEGIFLGSRTHLDLKKLDYSFAEILLDIKNFTEENKEKIKIFSQNSKYINTLILSLNKPNSIIQIFYKTEYELRETIDELRELLKDEIIELDLVLINPEEEEINSLPFL